MTDKQKSERGFIIEALKDNAVMLSQFYDGNIQIQLDVCREKRSAKIRITENIT